MEQEFLVHIKSHHIRMGKIVLGVEPCLEKSTEDRYSGNGSSGHLL